jgi:hypothetical protein
MEDTFTDAHYENEVNDSKTFSSLCFGAGTGQVAKSPFYDHDLHLRLYSPLRFSEQNTTIYVLVCPTQFILHDLKRKSRRPHNSCLK